MEINTGRLNRKRIEVQMDSKSGTAVAFVDRAFLARGSYAKVAEVVKRAEYDIYRIEGEFPIVYYPIGRFSASGEWVPNRS